MKSKILSFGFLARFVLLVAIVGVTMVIYDQSSTSLTNETSFFKKNNLEGNKLFYTEFNKKCVQACTDAGGVSCGLVNKNCCDKDSCRDKMLGKFCVNYIAITGCTSPS